jgi:hypothetical protein
MTEIHSIQENLSQYLSIPVTNSMELKTDTSAFQEPSIKNWVTYTTNHPEDANELLSFLADILTQDIDIYKKGIACILGGTLIEMGGDPTIIVDAIVHQLSYQLSLAESLIAVAEQENISIDPPTEQSIAYLFACDADATKSYLTAPFVVLATMTSICRVKAARQRLRMDSTLVNRVFHLEDEIDHLFYLKQVIYSADDMEMLVLHPESKTGLHIKADMIQNNFHFFTLLQDVYLSQFSNHAAFASYQRNDTAIQLAKGIAKWDNESLMDTALFGFYDFASLTPEGKLPASVPPANWLFGEGTLYHIPQLEKMPIVLLGENNLSDRSWDIHFCTPVHEALKPNLEILEILSTEQLQTQIDTILSYQAENFSPST